VSIYRVGLTYDLYVLWRAWRFRRVPQHVDMTRWALGRLRRKLSYIASQARARNWRAVHNSFNGWLAESASCPKAGRGATRARALADLAHHQRQVQETGQPGHCLSLWGRAVRRG
jgi:hypothetical protein